jgi:hypothetical protein
MGKKPTINPNADPVLTAKAVEHWRKSRLATSEIIFDTDLEQMCNYISSGLLTTVGAFKKVMGSGPNVVSTMRGEALAVSLRVEAMDRAKEPINLNPRQIRLVYIFYRIHQAEGAREARLTALALGIRQGAPQGKPANPCGPAFQILQATVYAGHANTLSNHAAHLAEQQESAAEPTPAQRRAWLAREAAALGVALVPKADPQT